VVLSKSTNSEHLEVRRGQTRGHPLKQHKLIQELVRTRDSSYRFSLDDASVFCLWLSLLGSLGLSIEYT